MGQNDSNSSPARALARFAAVCALAAACACTVKIGEPENTLPPDPAECGCTPGPHGDLIYVVSTDGGVHGFDPRTGEFSFIGDIGCAAAERPFSLAIDEQGDAWVMLVESQSLVRVDLEHPATCDPTDYVPGSAGFPYFGMSFTARADACPGLFVHSYSGDGPFAEGPGIGTLGVVDDQTGAIETIAAIDYDGGELAGTSDGRLLAFAGADPAVIVEYDPDTGAALDTLALDGFSKTNASAFAMFGGAAYLFTEARPPDCDPCLEAACPMDLAACRADEVCDDHLECVIETTQFSDDCGGELPQPMIDCVSQACEAECLVTPSFRTSQVTRVDIDGADQTREVFQPDAPLRVVGAGNSLCVPTVL